MSMKRKWIWAAGILAALGAAAAFGQTSVVTHAELQAVKADGSSDWMETLPFTIQGVILNDPEEMLDPAFNPEATGVPNGGQFQLFIQAVAAGDRGGTALFMSQMSYVPGNNYDEAAWNNEMQRVGYDGTGRKFRKGDRVEVTARQAIFSPKIPTSVESTPSGVTTEPPRITRSYMRSILPSFAFLDIRHSEQSGHIALSTHRSDYIL